MKSFIIDKVKEYEEELIGWRTTMHINPELSFHEENTTAFIVEQLESFGYEEIGVGYAELHTGVFAELNSHIPGPVIALRADIDALPIREESTAFFPSQNEGVSHACGHDAHIAIMLLTAKILYEIKDKIKAHIKIIFQPAEERSIAPGEGKTGAFFVRESGVLEGVSKIFALHVWGDYPAGKICCNTGSATAAVASFKLKLKGQGGHGGMPHLAIDPVTTLCNVVQNWQQIISREKNPFVPAVLTVGKIEAGSQYNIVPASGELCGTCRALSDQVLDFLAKRMQESAEYTAAANRCSAEFEFNVLHGCVNNDPECVKLVRDSAEELFGEEDFLLTVPVMAGEDFSIYTETVPGALFFLGMKAPEKGISFTQHHPGYMVNDSVIWKGAAMFISTVLKAAGSEWEE